MLILNLFEELEGPPEPTLVDALRDFLPLAVKHLELKKLPKIKLLDEVETDHMPSFGKFSNDDRTIHLGIKNRHPNDILRTLAHELTHYAQGQRDELDADSGATGSPEEDQANAEAGVIMREFNQQFPQYMELKPIMLEKWSKKYKKSINCSNPKGFSQKAHCAGRKKNTNEAEENLNENQEKYIIYLNDKPVSTYPTNREAEYQAKMVAQKFPAAKIDIKKEVCTLSPVQLAENLRDWFKKDKWVRMDTKGNIKGPCAREPGEGKPKCLPQAKAHALGKKGRAAAAQKKRREDPDPDRRGPAKNVATKVREQSTRRDPKDLTAPTDQELDKLHHKFIPTWSMLDHDLLATAYDFQDDDTALSYVNQLDDVEQSMDHNAVITIDNARVSIKVRTGDIDGLSRLDFEFALRANDLAKQLQADQLPHATNAINEQQFDENCWKGYHKEGNKKMFGKTVPNCVKNESITEQLCPECGGSMYPESMINEKQDACYYKVKSRYKVWPSAYASGALVQCRKKGAANWGNKSESVKENFADGKGPGRPGDSQRHGIPKGATISQLEKAAKAPGRKGQLARWQINMRRGKKK
jgi:pterin-4a-carbinolamine dehydratase/Zn-dependent peptidase ImmA (M78 family)